MVVPGFGLLPRATALHAKASFKAPKCNIIIEQNEQTRRLMLTIIPSREDCPFPLCSSYFQVESLVLDFKGRHILSSAKNFQLALFVPESASVHFFWTFFFHMFALLIFAVMLWIPRSQKPDHVLCQYESECFIAWCSLKVDLDELHDNCFHYALSCTFESVLNHLCMSV